MILVTDGNFTYVAIDEEGKPQVIPQANAPVTG
jgi:acyl-CoA hydrolase